MNDTNVDTHLMFFGTQLVNFVTHADYKALQAEHEALKKQAADDAEDAERGRWIIRNASWMRYEDCTAMYVELPMDVRLDSYALRQDTIDTARQSQEKKA